MNIPDYFPILLKNLKTMDEKTALYATVMELPQNGWSSKALISELQELLACHRRKVLRSTGVPMVKEAIRERFCYKNPRHTESYSSAIPITLHIVPIFGKRKTSESPA
ncbi:MAG: hypothetical protein Q7R64_03375 [bacterium]|nr:hypothetical protein [bacterium]